MLGLIGWTSWLVFTAYVGLFVTNSLLVTITKDSDNRYNYSTMIVVLLIEVTKLVISLLFYFRNHSIRDFCGDIQSNKSAFAYYLVPSALYCIFNNLVFLNLANFDPITYTVYLQFSIVITGFMYQCLFHRNLSLLQWVSLLVLTLGCLVSHLNDSKQFHFRVSDTLILIQVMCSSFAGVYNEYLLKNYKDVLNFWLQNILMYSDSCLCSLVLMAVVSQVNPSGVSVSSVRALYQPTVIAIMCTNVAGGLVTSVFLHNLNSIVKKFAAALDMVFLAVLSRILLGVAIEVTTVISIFLVSASIVVYSMNPLEIKKETAVKVKPTVFMNNN